MTRFTDFVVLLVFGIFLKKLLKLWLKNRIENPLFKPFVAYMLNQRRPGQVWICFCFNHKQSKSQYDLVLFQVVFHYEGLKSLYTTSISAVVCFANCLSCRQTIYVCFDLRGNIRLAIMYLGFVPMESNLLCQTYDRKTICQNIDST